MVVGSNIFSIFRLAMVAIIVLSCAWFGSIVFCVHVFEIADFVCKFVFDCVHSSQCEYSSVADECSHTMKYQWPILAISKPQSMHSR